MKLIFFTNPIVSWREPAAYTYRNFKPQMVYVCCGVLTLIFSFMEWDRIPSMWLVTGVLLIAGFPILFLWAKNRWPKAFPITGPPVTLYDNAFVLQGGRSQSYIELEKLTRCNFLKVLGKDGNYYYRLTFIPKEDSTKFQLSGILRETAVKDSATLSQILNFLRQSGITIHEENGNKLDDTPNS